MKKQIRALGLGATVLVLSLYTSATSHPLQTIEDYNSLLPLWGTSWSPGSKSINGYYPTFYTGFVMRSQYPERIHVRTSRGNQTRVSVILDQQTLTDYLFDLVYRADYYKRVTSSGPYNLKPSGANYLPQLSYFLQIVDSPVYDIRGFTARAAQGQESSEAVYQKSLQVLSALNPGRVFNLKIDLNREFRNWKQQMQALSGGDVAKITSNNANIITAINTVVFGRVNYTQKPTPEVLAQLNNALRIALGGGSDAELTDAALNLFRAATGTKYGIGYVNENGQWAKSIECSNGNCTLTYPEFTTIYPTGSIEAKTSDEFGNSINSFATPGLWQFLSRGGSKELDNIRNEPYYGFVPKMDYEAAGNGFHNPAVRFYGVSAGAKKALGITPSHNTLWAVKRGPVSHGCLRLSTGHVWEMRQIFPVEMSKATQVMFFGNMPQDFDVYDINGDGTPEVMGVEYLISYSMQGADGLARREGANLEINGDRKLDFYTSLYGARNVFRADEQKNIIFSNPRISMPSHLDYKRHGTNARLRLQGEFALYEQTYEKDKVQFYALNDMSQTSKDLVRLMGRVRGCAPSSNKQECGQAAFETEAKGRLR